jgi:hypothetical protein
VSSSVVGRSELEDGTGASRLCETGPSSGKGSGLATVVLAAATMGWPGRVICMYVCVGTVPQALGPTDPLVMA